MYLENVFYNFILIHSNILLFVLIFSASLSKSSASIFDCDFSIIYPPLDQPGPLYTVPSVNLSEYLTCYSGLNHEKRWILLIPGSTEEVKELFSWNWMPLFEEKTWSYCILELPDKGLGDLQIAAEYVVYAIRTIYKQATREKQYGIRRKVRINIIGHSLGGMLPRFAFRFWPDTRSMVYHLIAHGPTNHGTIMANIACTFHFCPIAFLQQRLNSSFLCALNSYKQTFSSIKYTNILSKFDELIRPLQSSHIIGEQVTNVYIQDLCPYRIYVEHLALGTYDYCSYVLTINALRSRPWKYLTSAQCCSKILMPRINRSTISFLGRVVYSAEEHARQLVLHFGQGSEEPPLRCPFRSDCILKNKTIDRFNRR